MKNKKHTFINISKLYPVKHEYFAKGKSMSESAFMENCYLTVDDGIISGVGEMDSYENEGEETTDLSERVLIPTFVDSHTHFVFAADRASEFVDRIKGLSYQEIANKGGGILNSAKALEQKSEDELYKEARQRVDEAMLQGTGAFEIKSGYGLSKEAEIKILRVIKRLKNELPVPIKSTFLGAHAVPASFKGRTKDYVKHVIEEILPSVVSEDLADYIDVFCEKGYFDPEDLQQVLTAGEKHGLKGKIHVNQFNSIGGIETAVDQQVLSVDHLETLSDNEMNLLLNSNVIPVALPSCSFFLNIPYAPVRQMVDKGLGVVLASDFNPGSTPSFNLQFVWSLACIKGRLLPQEALTALTYNAACAIESQHEIGSLEVGKRAQFIQLKKGLDINHIPYQFGRNAIEKVFMGSMGYLS